MAPVIPSRPGVSVVGIGADGWAGLGPAARRELCGADVVIGGARQLALLPEECRGERVAWPSPLRPAVPRLLAAHADRRVAVLASGDPLFHGIGRAVAEEAAALRGEGVAEPRFLPHPSSVSYACARLGWPLEDTDVVTLVGRPTDRLAAALHDGRRLLVLSAGAGTPAEVAALLRDRGFGPSALRVLEQLGGPRERVVPDAGATADDWSEPPGDPLNIVAVECRRAPGAVRLGAVPGLPDTAYENDGQLTKRYVRAATLAALAPAPGELLWDVGGGSGSIAIEWLRAHHACRAVSVERDPVRAARIERNAARLGVPGLRVVTGAAPAALAELPAPDAVFVGGGLTAPGLLDTCWAALPPGGRLVVNTVTLESEALLADAHRRYGGELVRLAVAHAVPVGTFTGWRQAMPVTQWAATKPEDGRDPAGNPPPSSADAPPADPPPADAPDAAAPPGAPVLPDAAAPPGAGPASPPYPTAPGGRP
ncbi:precorrin-6Y C5,15-methyltransferase [Streptomyces sulfonofaciens]|uniref:Precorrin-6Y C5,15-methyltransferase n=1 Tax=Streptomyces sulfonofaciens TaxID=68272 RepID=A0A919KRP7_9ACTN|nr:precorrin-6y C5,15-methyltransferase (decarboxylating) subunit CbiE [Streptomyces sulfonofaciens]GHH70735.1 precorrin-6Y C5,15-methyltransferase [Streptomyces sulfonofaciens]